MNKDYASLDLPDTHAHALVRLIEIIPPHIFLWVLSGSGSLRLHGVDLPVHDLDILTDEQTVFQIEQHLAEFMTVPVHPWDSPGMHSLEGKAEIEGIEIELLANIAHKLPDGSWVSFTDFSRVEWIDRQGLQIPTFPLEDELKAYIAMGRPEKASAIRKTISSLTEN